MKLFIYIINIEEALNNDFAWSLTISDRNDLEAHSDYQLIKEIETDININRASLTKTAVDLIDEKITEIQATTAASITLLETKQQNLLAITAE